MILYPHALKGYLSWLNPATDGPIQCFPEPLDAPQALWSEASLPRDRFRDAVHPGDFLLARFRRFASLRR